MSSPPKATEAKVSDVIGPLPGSMSSPAAGMDYGLVVLAAGGKSFPVKGHWLECWDCHSLLKGEEPPPYFFSTHIIKSVGKQLSEAVIFRLEDGLGCRLLMGGKTPSKFPTDLVVSGINMALCGNAPILVEDAVLDGIRDSFSAYTVLKSTVPILWGLDAQVLSQTQSLEALSGYLDEAMPEDKVFK
jgi:hypothetical protein